MKHHHYLISSIEKEFDALTVKSELSESVIVRVTVSVVLSESSTGVIVERTLEADEIVISVALKVT